MNKTHLFVTTFIVVLSLGACGKKSDENSGPNPGREGQNLKYAAPLNFSEVYAVLRASSWCRTEGTKRIKLMFSDVSTADGCGTAGRKWSSCSETISETFPPSGNGGASAGTQVSASGGNFCVIPSSPPTPILLTLDLVNHPVNSYSVEKGVDAEGVIQGIKLHDTVLGDSLEYARCD